MVDVPKDGGLEKYDASQNSDIIEGEFEEITEPEAKSAEPEIEPEVSKPETKKPEEDVASPEPEQSVSEEDIAMQAYIKAEAERNEKQKLQEQLDALAKKQNQAQSSKSEPQNSNLTAQEQRFLKERVLGRENAVDGSESKIHLANGKQILETTVKIKGEERDFVGYKSRFRKMDEESALAIVLTAKENGWDSIEVHGSKKSKEMLARVATEHGLDVGNYKLPEAEVETPKQEAPKQEAPKQEASKPEAPKQEASKQEAPKQEEPKQMVVSNLSGFTNAPVKVTSNFAQIGVDDKKPALPASKDDTPKLSGPEGKPSLPPPEEPKALPPPPPKTGMASP